MPTLPNSPSGSVRLELACLRALDTVQHLPELQRFDPARFVNELSAELSGVEESVASLGAQLDALSEVLQTIEQFIVKAMGIHLTHVLATEPAPPQLRTLISTTVTAYADDLGLLRRRFENSVSPRLLESILATARSVLAARQILRYGTLDLGRQIAQRNRAWLDRAVRNKMLADAERLRLRLARVELQKVAENPPRLATERFEARLKKLPPPDEEIEVEDNTDAKAERFALLEID